MFPTLLVLGAVFAVYLNCVHSPFLFDDAGAVVNNPTIRHLWTPAVLNPPADGSTTTGRPLVNLSFAINYAISGLDVWSYHVTNLALHGGCALVLLGLLRRTLEKIPAFAQKVENAHTVAVFAVLLWAVHPLNTESVICIAQRTESLCGLFFALTFYGFARSVDSNRASRIWRIVSVASCLAGMATKEVMATAPLLLLLYDRTFVSGSFQQALRRHRGYYLALGSTWLLLGLLVVRGGGARGLSAGFGLGVSSWHYLLQQARAIIVYLKLSVWPSPLVIDYGTALPHSLVDVGWQALVVLLLLGATVWALVRKPALGFAGAWFFVILAPSTSVIPLITQPIAEHRMYLPLLGVIVVVMASLQSLSGVRLLRAVTCVFLILFGALTVRRTYDYRDVQTIWQDTVTKCPTNARAHSNLAVELQRLGRADDANLEFAKATSLQENYVTAYYDWGVALLQQQRFSDAINRLEKVTQLSPDFADAHLNLGIAQVRVGNLPAAIAEFKRALEIQPTAADIRQNLGLALELAGRNAEARPFLGNDAVPAQQRAESHFHLGQRAEEAGDLAAAERDYAEALRLMPSYTASHAALGVLYAKTDRLVQAAQQLEAAAQLSPQDPDVLSNLGNVYLLQGKTRAAIEQYEASLRIRPDDTGTKQNLQIARDALNSPAP